MAANAITRPNEPLVCTYDERAAGGHVRQGRPPDAVHRKAFGGEFYGISSHAEDRTKSGSRADMDPGVVSRLRRIGNVIGDPFPAFDIVRICQPLHYDNMAIDLQRH